MSGKNLVLSFAVLFLFFFLALYPVSAVSNFDVKLVSYVKDFGLYIAHEPTYEKGDEIRVYAQAENVNHRRAYAVDFAFVVYDPKGYAVQGGIISKTGKDWTDKVYAVYDFKIPKEWKTGTYKVEVYVFDVLNSTATYKEYKTLRDRIINSGSSGISIHKLPRSQVYYLKKSIEFKVVENVKSRIFVFNSKIKALVLPVGLNNSIIVSLYNSGEKEADFFARLYVDGKKITKQEVFIRGKEFKKIEFQIPQLEEGKHRISIVFDWDSVVFKKTPPIVVDDFVFDKPILLSKYGDGVIVLSQNNYIIGGLKSKMNLDSAAHMLTNILAYAWKEINGNGDIRTGIYIKSNKTARDGIERILDEVVRISKAPIKFKGIVEDDELDGVDVLLYADANFVVDENLEEFVKNGGVLILDTSDYWFNDYGIVKRFDLKEDNRVYTSFFDLLHLNKTVDVRVKAELKLPPELKYSNLTISDFLVDVGTPVKISFDVVNVGGAGKARVLVYANDQEIYNQTFAFFTNERKHIEFEFTPEKEGAYKITVVDKKRISKILFAKSKAKKPNESIIPTPTPLSKPERRNGVLITALAGILAFLIALRIYLRK